jgi:hypothetical protein
MMSRINFSGDPVMKKLRAVMMGAMLFSVFLTLAGQPASFWANPETAMRGDGLGVHNAVNHTLEFLLSDGWQPFLCACLVYLALALVAVSILPRKPALITSLSIIFGHYFATANWLAVGWHLGFNGVAVYGIVLGTAIAWAVSPIPAVPGGQIIRRLRWVMFCVMLMDPLVTLLGEPASYWAHPETVHEGNSFWRWSMMQGWWVYILMDLAYCAGAFWLVTNLPRFYGVMVLFAFTFGHFIGASNWFFYEWRLGMQVPVVYGILLSSTIVLLSFRRGQKSNATAGAPSAIAASGRPVCC